MADTASLPDVIVQYIAGRDNARATAVAGVLSGLTERERLLVTDAAVMGWVQGMRHHDLEYPGNHRVVPMVVDACLAFSDLYPTLTASRKRCEQCGRVGTRGFKTLAASEGIPSITVCTTQGACRKRWPKQPDPQD